MDLEYEEKLQGSFRGAIVGTAIGGAVGFPYAGCSRSYMRALDGPLGQKIVSHRSGLYPAGQLPGDVQLILATIDSILDVGRLDGSVLAVHLLPLWRDRVIACPSRDVDQAMGRLLRGECDWQDAGNDVGYADNGAATRAAPIGLWNFDDPDGLVRDSRTASWLTHQDPLAAAGMACIAAAVAYSVEAEELLLGDLLDRVASAVERLHEGFAERIHQFPFFLSLGEEEALERISALGSDDAAAAGDGISEFVIPSVFCSLYYFLLSPYDFSRTVEGCLRAGGDIPTTAAMAGALSGAFNGLDALPEGLQSQLLQRQEIVEKADALYHLKRQPL